MRWSKCARLCYCNVSSVAALSATPLQLFDTVFLYHSPTYGVAHSLQAFS